jgi:matrixin/Big-like domain-containing protein
MGMAVAAADNPLLLRKPLRLETAYEPRVALEYPVKRRTAGRSHLLVRFATMPSLEHGRELERRGIRVVEYLPEGGFAVALTDGTDLDGLDIEAAARPLAKQKISPYLKEGAASQGETALVEFFPDVEREDSRALLQEHGFEVLDHPDVVRNQWLVRGDQGQLRELAGWDEVSYIFPGSEDLSRGERVRACAGAITALGYVGQSAAVVGDGWDGSGRGGAQLGYFYEKLSSKLPPDAAKEQIRKAMLEWARYATLSFLPATGSQSARTLNILFAPRNHGDMYPFDGFSGVLAHTYYPAPPNPEPLAGDIHFDDEEEWVIGPDLSRYSADLFSVALHELGHALGLGHSDLPGAVMYPYYRRIAQLAADDIAAIQTLYAAPGTNPGGGGALTLQIQSPGVFPHTTTQSSVGLSGTVTGGSGAVTVNWSTSRGAAGVAQGGRDWSISALPLQAGYNAVTITATDEAYVKTSRTVTITLGGGTTAPDLRITSPTTSSTYTAVSPAVTIAGTASHPSGIARVDWVNARGGGGLASGTSNWQTGTIGLQTGSNEITITTSAASGAKASRKLTVSFGGGPDTVAPAITITYPNSTTVATYSTSISVRGTATDNAGVTAVTWSVSSGKSGNATGTNFWATPEIPLLVGTNTVVVKAFDTAGNASWRSITVTRR